MPFIEVIVNPQGQSEVQTYGFEGAACRVGGQFVERALGNTLHEQLTPEFHQSSMAMGTTEAEAI